MTIERGDIIGVILGKLQGNESEKHSHGYEVRMISAILFVHSMHSIPSALK